MDHVKTYQRLIAKAVAENGRPRNLRDTRQGYENHHIIPKSFFPGGAVNPEAHRPDNLVRLTLRQHFLAHWLLANIHGGKMSFTFAWFCSRTGRATGRAYERHRAEGVAARNADPEWRENQFIGAQKRSDDPQWRERNLAALRARENDPEYVAQRRELMTNWQNNPEWVRNHTAGVRIRSADPAWLAKHRAHLVALTSSPEWRERNARNNRERAKDPEWLAANAERVRRIVATPEWKAKHAATAARRVKPAIGTRIRDGQRILLLGQTAIEAAGFDQGSVSECCRDPARSHLGYRWHYASQDEIDEGGFATPEPERRKLTRFIGTPLDGGPEIEIIGTAALTAAGFTQANVTKALRGRIKSSGGYRWRYGE